MSDGTIVLLAALALVALTVGIAALVTLHLLPTGYSPIKDAVSDYGVGRYAWGYRTQVIAIGLAAALEAVAFHRDGTAGTAGIVWLAIYAAARIAIAWAPTDLPDAERTRTGRVHAVLAILAFTAIAISTSSIPNELAGAPAWTDWAGALNSVGTLVVVAAIATAVAVVLPPVRRVFGLVERLLYLASLVWLILAAIALVSVAG